jgi:DNA-binding NarL/FixJ family response regulator
MIRLIIADDHAIVREGLKQLFALHKDIVVAGVAVNGAEVLEALRRNKIDILLLDMTMPGIHGAELIKRIRSEEPILPILILSMHNESQIARSALKAGASGYVTKDCDPDILLEAIRKVAAGGRFIDPALAEAMAFDSSPDSLDGPQEILSGRELHILRLLLRGMSINEIAEELVISNKTVSTHKARLMQKLNIHNIAELVRYGDEHHLT